MVFPVVMYGCETWTIKKAEHQRMDAFELWCWRKLLESLGLQGDQTNQSWEISPEYFFERTDAEVEAPVLWPPEAKNRFIGRTDAEVEAPVFWSPNEKSRLIRKDPLVGKD